MDSKDSTTQRPKDVISPITPSIAQAATMEMVQLPQPPQNPMHPITQSIQLTQRPVGSSTLPKPLIAKEEEIKQFFATYIDRYTRKDIEGFLSCFSSKAIQNQKDGLPEIRKIYSDFFNQSRELHYLLEDPKIEIYQNAVEVKARYQIDQVLTKVGGKKVLRGNIRWVLVKKDGTLRIITLDYENEKST
jgi:hypothetical protein